VYIIVDEGVSFTREIKYVNGVSFTWGKFKPSAMSHNDIQHRKTGEP